MAQHFSAQSVHLHMRKPSHTARWLLAQSSSVLLGSKVVRQLDPIPPAMNLLGAQNATTNLSGSAVGSLACATLRSFPPCLITSVDV